MGYQTTSKYNPIHDCELQHILWIRGYWILRKNLTYSFSKSFHRHISSLSYTLSNGLYDLTIRRIYASKSKEEKVVLMQIIATWLGIFEIIDVYVVFSMNDASSLPLCYESYFEEFSGINLLGKILCLYIIVIVKLCLVVGRTRLIHDGFFKYVDRLVY